MARIAVSAEGPTLDSKVDAHFSRCSYFIIVDPEDKSFHAVENMAKELAHGAGVEAARRVLEQDVQTVITGILGPQAAPVLKTAGVVVYQSKGETVSEALDRLARGELATITVGPSRRRLE